jgi:hypothetical protein
MSERSKTIPLAWPLDHLDPPIKSVTLRRARGRDLAKLEPVFSLGRGGAEAGAKDPGVGDMILIVSVLGDLPPEVADELDAEDLINLAEAAASFFPQARATGAP